MLNAKAQLFIILTVKNSAALMSHFRKGTGDGLTKKGYLCLAPADTSVGDCVSLFSGGATPYMVRRTSGTEFEFIGEMYAPGIMYGEAWDQGKCSAITLV